jgi:hypothetical protein
MSACARHRNVGTSSTSPLPLTLRPTTVVVGRAAPPYELLGDHVLRHQGRRLIRIAALAQPITHLLDRFPSKVADTGERFPVFFENLADPGNIGTLQCVLCPRRQIEYVERGIVDLGRDLRLGASTRF